MAFCDFAIRYDPKKDTPESLTKKILYSIIIRRLKGKKPAVIFLCGDSGEGKSYASLRLQQILLEIQGVSFMDHLEDMNVYTPLEYPKKLDKLLFDKELKKVNLITLHEAREVIKSKLWYEFLPQAVADINAMSRTIKRMCIIIISQFIRDITKDMRFTIKYYIKASRPIGKKTRLYINVLWKDDRDLENPKLRKRKLSGYLVYPNGAYKRYVPRYLIISKPPKEAIEMFEKREFEAKSSIIKKKITKLVKLMELDIGISNKKIIAMVNFYSKNPQSLNMIGKQRAGKWKIIKEVRQTHDLTEEEVKEFQTKLNEELKAQEVIQNEKPN